MSSDIISIKFDIVLIRVRAKKPEKGANNFSFNLLCIYLIE